MEISMSPTQNIGTVVQNLSETLKLLSPELRQRAFNAAMALIEEPAVPQGKGGAREPEGPKAVPTGSEPQSPTSYFSYKAPKSKSEVLAVAARYREQNSGNEDGCSKEELKKVITDAGQDFNDRTFSADIGNAKNQARLFSKGGKRDSYQLSDYGRKYVDALPDHERAANLRGRSSSSRRKTRGKRGTTEA
jgi:hypothetical protein